MQSTRFSRRDLLGAAAGALPLVAALAEPLKAAEPRPSAAGADASSWADPTMPEVTHRMIEANGIRIHVAEQGTGPLVILCHGFPECWYSWRHQLGALAKAGFHAVAPDLRGYGRSDRPEEVEKYTVLHDVGDVVGLVDALGVKQAVIAGHDIGATIAWQAALLRPDRFKGVIALGPPFRPRAFGGEGPPTSVMPQTRDAMFYQLFLQTPAAEAALSRDMRRTFRSQFYSLSADRPASTNGGVAQAGMVPRKGAAFTEPASLPAWITEADVDVYVAEFTRSGWRGPLSWWRNIDRGWELMAALDGAEVNVPALYMVGERDLLAEAFRSAIALQSTLIPKLRPPIMLPNCGHWTQQERASEVSAAMIEFLRQVHA
ncbi:MAG TPA: alpha/beta hydrolase [Bradyrhizobium sp.]|uniref:alpha/beta fold hydrolase n=1 Tax=Bradyrhizobium sp. TaxID=376 RepID=UPI002BD6291C|nr:alpha/beta hydrolase [Bradyrhizobium sp.]HLZ02530.1 alpha/beta hydrolase [Bradyrhizobium sp.]